MNQSSYVERGNSATPNKYEVPAQFVLVQFAQHTELGSGFDTLTMGDFLLVHGTRRLRELGREIRNTTLTFFALRAPPYTSSRP